MSNGLTTHSGLLVHQEFDLDKLVRANTSQEALESTISLGELPRPWSKGLTRLETLLGAPMAIVLTNLLSSPLVRLSRMTKRSLEAKLAKLLKDTNRLKKRTKKHYTQARAARRAYSRKQRSKYRYTLRASYFKVIQLARKNNLKLLLSRSEFYSFLSRAPVLDNVPLWKLLVFGLARLQRLNTKSKSTELRLTDIVIVYKKHVYLESCNNCTASIMLY